MGSKEGIMHISMAFLNEGDQVLIPNPGYPTYTSVTKLVGAEPFYYNLKDAYQATFILENVIKNFSQFEDIVKEAQAELDAIKTNEAKTNNSVTPKN